MEFKVEKLNSLSRPSGPGVSGGTASSSPSSLVEVEKEAQQQSWAMHRRGPSVESDFSEEVALVVDDEQLGLSSNSILKRLSPPSKISTASDPSRIMVLPSRNMSNSENVRRRRSDEAMVELPEPMALTVREGSSHPSQNSQGLPVEGDEKGPKTIRRGSFAARKYNRSNSESELLRMYDLEIDEFEQLKHENLALKAKITDLEKRLQIADNADPQSKGMASLCTVCGQTRMHVDESDKDVCYTVSCADKDRTRFAQAEARMSRLLTSMEQSPYDGHIRTMSTRQIVLNGSALSHNFYMVMKSVIDDEDEALQFVREIMSDVAKRVGSEDCLAHPATSGKKKDIQTHLCEVAVKLAFSGFGRVEVTNGMRHPNECGYHQIFTVRNSFEADSFLKGSVGRIVHLPVCAMFSGYIAGWAEGSFKLPMACHEITCRARGDVVCRFLLAPPDRIQFFVNRYADIHPHLKVCTTLALAGMQDSTKA